MLDERKLDVLRAIVEDFVSTNEPVGSKALVERHHLGVSPATVRNDMAALEDEGYIAQPHTSAGRVPTERGYRLFVDRLSTIKPLSPAERRAIEQFLAHGLQMTEARTGALIFVSLAERHAEIVADAGIAAKVPQAVWEEAIAALVGEIRTGRLGEGLVAAVGQVGAVLAAHFPPRPDDRDAGWRDPGRRPGPATTCCSYSSVPSFTASLEPAAPAGLRRRDHGVSTRRSGRSAG